MSLVTSDFADFRVPADWEANLSQKINTSTGTFTRTDNAGESTDYSILQFHFHSPSEHSIEGQLYDAEVHFVHADDPANYTELSVIGVLLQVSDTSSGIADAFMASIAASVADKDLTGEDEEDARLVKIQEFLDAVDALDFWQY